MKKEQNSLRPVPKEENEKNTIRIDIFSLFPDYFRGPFDVSMVKRAREKKIVDLRLHNIRDFTKDRHRKVDDRPYGGGPGMVLTPQPVCDAIASVKREGSHVVHLSPQGYRLSAKKCEELAAKPHLILLCGHYEGIDERALVRSVDEEISIGDYVLTNGCIAAIVVVDAVIRFVPGVLGHCDAAKEDSFQEGILGGAVYTRPEVFEGMAIPGVLKSGHHHEIGKWQEAQKKEKTERVRPDLLVRRST